MNKKFENEEFISKEVSEVLEYQTFDVEELKSIELFSEPFEELRSVEVQPQSFVEEQKETKPLEKNKLSEKELRNKLNKLRTTSSSSTHASTAASTAGSIATSIGSTGVLVVGGLLGGTLILDMVDSNNVNALETIVLNYYEINPTIQYLYDEQTGTDETIKINEIKIFFDDKLEDEYSCNVLDLQSNETFTYDSSLGYVSISTTNDGLLNYEVQLLNNNKVIDSYNLEVNTISPIEYMESDLIDYIQTFNEDGSTNLYCNHFIYADISSYNLYNKITLYNGDINSVVSVDNPISESTLGYIEDINEYYDMFTSSIYIQDGKAHYLISDAKEVSLQTKENYNYDLSLDKNILSLSFYQEVLEDVVIDVTYTNENLTEQFIISKDKFINGSYSEDIKLSYISNEVLVDISTDVELNNYNVNNSISNYKGVSNKPIKLSQTFTNSYTTNISLRRLEVAPYNACYGWESGTPTKLYFDGFLMGNDKLTVEVYDSTNALVNSVTDISDVSQPIVFLDLPVEELRFDYKITNGTTEISSASYTTNLDNTLLNELDYSYLSYSSPSDVGIGYNEDGTANIYISLVVEHLNTNYETYNRVDYYSSSQSIHPVATYEGNDQIVVMKNVPTNNSLAMNYFVYVLADDGITAYGELGVAPSGSIEFDYTTMYTNVQQDSSNTNLYVARCYNLAYAEPFTAKIYFDGSSEGIDIAYEDISEDGSIHFTVDLTEYTFTSFKIQITGSFSRHSIAYKEDIINAMEEANEQIYKDATIEFSYN